MPHSPKSKNYLASIGGATAMLSANAMVAFKEIPRFPLYGTLRSLVIGVPVAFTLGLIYKRKRSANGAPETSVPEHEPHTSMLSSDAGA